MISNALLFCFSYKIQIYEILGYEVQGPPSNVFLTSDYFVNGSTQLMSDLIDNQFYPSARRIWLCIRLNNAGLSGPAIDLQKIPNLAKKILFSNAAHFDLGRYVNKQNCHIWGTENPYAYIEKPTHSKRFCVWCRFWSKGIIGLFFFENEQRESVTADGDRYRAMLNEFLFTKIEEEDIGNIWFQQGVVLRPVFEDRIISRRANVVWPPRSCDLTPLDY